LFVRRFVAADWPWVQRWFDDPILNRALGPLDEDWVRHVTSDPEHVQLVLETEERPIALVGVAWDPDGRSHVITDFAVDPKERRTGLGRRALEASTTGYDHPPARGWIAFVDPDNAKAAAFFLAVGWVDQGMSEGMRQFGTSDR
jgi:GNAT superfamily N-acetyltransferase